MIIKDGIEQPDPLITAAEAYTDSQIAALSLGTASSLAADTDTSLAANSDTRVATQKAIKSYVDAAVTGLLDFKGVTDCSGNPNYPAASKGDAYVVSVAGKIGGASGSSVDIGDTYLAIADNAGGTQASVGTSWAILEHNLQGAVIAANNGSDFADVGTVRTNLGLGGAATLAVGTTAGTVAAGDDSRITAARSFGFVADGGGSTLTTGVKGYVRMPYAGTITGWSILAVGSSPTCTIDVWRVASGTALPTVANTIMGTKPALSTGNAIKSTTLTSWNPVAVVLDDIWAFNLDAVANATWLEFKIYVTKT